MAGREIEEMQTVVDIKSKLEDVFPKEQAGVLAEVITDAYSDLVKTSDFNELKGIVRELAEAQKRTEARVRELAEAQKATEKEIRLLAKSLTETRGELGGLSKSVSYGFENEVYRMLPGLLKKVHSVEIKEKLIRTELGGKEINILGKATRDGKDTILVGEVKLRLDDRRKKGERDVFAELEEKIEMVRGEYGDVEIIGLLVTHYATKGFLEKARRKGVLVVQSFEW